MRLQVKGKNVEVTPSIRAYAERKLGKLEKQLAEQTQVEVELSEQKNPSIAESHVAEATIFTKGPTLRAREASTDMKASIDQLVDEARAPGEEVPRAPACRASEAHRAQRRRPRILTLRFVRLFGRKQPLHRTLADAAGLSLGDGSARALRAVGGTAGVGRRAARRAGHPRRSARLGGGTRSWRRTRPTCAATRSISSCSRTARSSSRRTSRTAR